jgi:inner membrane protein
MFPLGHIGISIGIIYLLASYIQQLNKKNNFTTSLAENIDFRIVIVAAMLPDIIDKTMGMIIFKEEISNGRLFTHSLVIVGVISIWLFFMAKLKYGHRFKMFFYISPIWFHLLLDRMWEEPRTLFWPIFGMSFPRIDVEFSDYLTILLSSPYTLFGEILGLGIIFALVMRYRLFIKTYLFNFLKDGKLKTLTS